MDIISPLFLGLGIFLLALIVMVLLVVVVVMLVGSIVALVEKERHISRLQN